MRSSRVAVLLFAFALAGGGVVACASILGIDDRSPYSPDASVEASGAEPGDAGPEADVVFADARQEGGTAPEADGGDGGGEAADAPPSDSAAESTSDAPGDAAADVVTADAPSCPDPCLLASGLNHPFLMTADSNNVYWTEFGDTLGSGNGSVKSCPASGCGAGGPTVLAQGLTNPRGVAVDAQYVYFATATYGGVTGAIWKCAVGGCSGIPVRLAAASIPFGVAVDSTSVYWVDNDNGTVNKVDKTDGGVTVLYDGGAYDDAGSTILEPGECIVDGPFLYLMDYSEDALRVSVTDGTITYLGSGFNQSVYGNYFGMTTDSANLYFGGNGIVLRSPKAAPDAGGTLVNGVAVPDGLQYDPASGMIYWSNYGTGSANDGTVGKFAPDGGGVQTLQASLVTPESVAVGDRYVYWISNGTLDLVNGGTVSSTGALWRTTK
ncbi:MAG TPA: hypothetical protein VE987_04495 [Polyangiaceae bacterium]|nr:hypothetical protein [Polyangiaceae bacterium]